MHLVHATEQEREHRPSLFIIGHTNAVYAVGYLQLSTGRDKHQLPGMYTYDIGKEMNPGNGVDLSAHGTASFARRTVLLLYVLLCIDGADASIQLVHTAVAANTYVYTM